MLPFHAGECKLAELSEILDHVPGCTGCAGMYSAVGKQLGAVKASWEESLEGYDPEALLKSVPGAEGPSAGPWPVALHVMRGEMWDGAVRQASALLFPIAPAAAPGFGAAPPPLPIWKGLAGGLHISISTVQGGSLEVRVVGIQGGLVRFEAEGRVLCEALLDAHGHSFVTHPPRKPFDAVRLLAPPVPL